MKYSNLLRASILALLLLLAAPAWGEEVTLIRVVDGDSLVVEMRGLRMRVRMAGIDAPEYNQPGGTEAKEFVKKWCGPKGSTLDLEIHTTAYDRYDRLLAWVWRGDELLQELLVKSGLAEIYWLPKKDRHYGRLVAG